MALKQQDRMLERNRKIVADNRLLIDTFLEEYSDLFEWNSPQGGCIGLMKLKKGDIDEFAAKMIEYGRYVLPVHSSLLLSTLLSRYTNLLLFSLLLQCYAPAWTSVSLSKPSTDQKYIPIRIWAIKFR